MFNDRQQIIMLFSFKSRDPGTNTQVNGTIYFLTNLFNVTWNAVQIKCLLTNKNGFPLLHFVFLNSILTLFNHYNIHHYIPLYGVTVSSFQKKKSCSFEQILPVGISTNSYHVDENTTVHPQSQFANKQMYVPHLSFCM